MYCTKCGVVVSLEAKFCYECGTAIILGSVNDSGTCSAKDSAPTRKRPRFASQTSTTTAVCFEKFREKKYEERTSRFKKGKVTSYAGGQKKCGEVNIQIGVMKLRDGELKIVRGTTLPLKVLPTIGVDELLKKSAEKMLKFNKDLQADADKLCLVYPDRTEIKCLPGSSEAFLLSRYKEELGKPYARITLYLCRTCEYYEASFCETMKFLQDADEMEENLNFSELIESSNTAAIEIDTLPQVTESHSPMESTSTVAIEARCSSANESNTFLDLPQLTTSSFGTVSDVMPSSDTCSFDSQENADIFTHSVEALPDITDCPVHPVVLHRALIKTDMIQAFKEPEILQKKIDVTFIGHNGKVEEGKGDGVVRDALTTFWQQFFNSLTVGAQERVPAIRHDYQRGEWVAIARILVYGYVRIGYCPLSLSRAFLATCLFGEDKITNEFLLASFRPYLSDDEREALEKCFSEDVLPDDEDVLDFLSNYKCFRNPSKENLLQIVNELAHQEIIQKPRYVIHCWAPILKLLTVYSDFKSIKDLENLYDIKKPTAKKVLRLIKSEPSTEQERQSLDYLKKYIRSLQGNMLNLFLHFVTGSDIISCSSIEVTFSALDGAARRPVTHTCGPLIEIPSTYQTYNELSEEFSELLQQKDAWQFNIV